MNRRIYLKTTSLESAQKIWQTFYKMLRRKEEERLPVSSSLNRVTSRPVFAKVSSPSFDSSAMDGYAVRFEETVGASEKTPVKLKLGTQAISVNTGDPLPEGFNAVVMIEDTYREGDYIIIHSPLGPYQNVRNTGEDIVQTELILPENHVIRPVDIGALLAGGHKDVWVRKKPLVSLIPTGDEIVDPGSPLTRGKIVDYNSFMLGALVVEWGGIYERVKPVRDNLEELNREVQKSHHADVVAIIAGSSAGSKDFTPDVVSSLGEVFVHGVSMRPGKPLLLGKVGERPVIGVPGYPVSAYITFDLFCKPLIFHLLGLEPPERPKTVVEISRPVASPLGQDEFLRVKIGSVKGRYIASPVGRGAGAVMTIQRADGIIKIPQDVEMLQAGDEIEAELLRPLSEIEKTLVCIGSHDNTLDILANFLKKEYPGYSLSSAHVGSMGGIIAIKKAQAHIAGTHLLDEDTGEYNVSFVKRYLQGIPLDLVNLVYRVQGLIVKKGNPKGIKGIKDLTRDDIIFVNRQPGSGTRLLTDKVIREAGISPQEIKGYEREEYTHMSVAGKVASGSADAGMGILTAALALGLDFIPITKERYDLIIPKEYQGLPQIRAFLEIIKSNKEFKQTIESLGGYDVSQMGEVVYSQ